jgi:hypothetical protein
MNRTVKTNSKNKGGYHHLFFLISLFLIVGRVDLCRANDWEPLPWGLNLEQLNQAYQKKYPTGQIKEDRDRSDIELQYSSAKSVKFKRGEVIALISSKDSASAYRLFGYNYEGKFFGQVIFFKDHPEFFPETINTFLKKTYPEGKNIRTFGATRIISVFEYKSEKLLVFTSEKGIFFYEPTILEKMSKKFLEQKDQEQEKEVKKWRDAPVMP